MEQLRLIKDADEISQIRASVLLAASLFQTALSVIKPGVAETQVAASWSCRRAGLERRRCRLTRSWRRGRVRPCRMGAHPRKPFLPKDL